MTLVQQALAVATAAAREAGSLALQHAGSGLHLDRKSNRADLVTEIDRQAEQLIRRRIDDHFPDHHILGEEQGGQQQQGGPRWLIDPIDGTLNFVCGFPYYATSIALEIDGAPQVAVVFDPERDELFSARRGGGAFCNGRALEVSATARLDEAMLATGFAYHDDETKVQTTLSRVAHVVARCRGLRRPGAASLDLVNVACGRFDGFWEADLKPWDTAAGALIVTEAGGRVSGLDGRAHQPGDPVIVASNAHLHDALRACLRAPLK